MSWLTGVPRRFEEKSNPKGVNQYSGAGGGGGNSSGSSGGSDMPPGDEPASNGGHIASAGAVKRNDQMERAYDAAESGLRASADSGGSDTAADKNSDAAYTVLVSKDDLDGTQQEIGDYDSPADAPRYLFESAASSATDAANSANEMGLTDLGAKFQAVANDYMQAAK